MKKKINGVSLICQKGFLKFRIIDFIEENANEYQIRTSIIKMIDMGLLKPRAKIDFKTLPINEEVICDIYKPINLN